MVLLRQAFLEYFWAMHQTARDIAFFIMIPNLAAIVFALLGLQTADFLKMNSRITIIKCLNYLTPRHPCASTLLMNNFLLYFRIYPRTHRACPRCLILLMKPLMNSRMRLTRVTRQWIPGRCRCRVPRYLLTKCFPLPCCPHLLIRG